MNKDLIELQRGSKATAVVILEDNINELGHAIVMNAQIDDVHLFGRKLGDPIFKKQLEKKSKSDTLAYFVISGICGLDNKSQNRFVGLVKDREFGGYNLPGNIIMVFTVKNREELKKMSKELYKFCVVTF